jgi:hypothetical protein
MNFVNLVNAYGRTMPKAAPPIIVAHPNYGELGSLSKKGFEPVKGRWASANAIMKDSSNFEIKTLRRIEDFGHSIGNQLYKTLKKYPILMPQILQAISTYDGIVSSRGGGTGHDYWMAMTATLGGVTLSWYDSWVTAWTPGSVPSVTSYADSGTGGAVMNSASNGSWLHNASGSTLKYIVSVGISTPNITGFTLAMLVDNLFAGSYVITSNVTINPSSDIAVTRWSSTADSKGNMMMCTMASTLTHGGAPTITTTYVADDDSSDTTISVAPATGVLVNRVVFNTLHNSATVVACTPFMPLTNGGAAGVKNLSQVAISGGTSVTAGTIHHKIVRPLVIMPFIAANSYIEQDTTLNIGNMCELKTVSQVCGCLGWLVFTGGTTATTMSSMVRTCEG